MLHLLCIYLFRGKVVLCSSGCPSTCNVDQDSCEYCKSTTILQARGPVLGQEYLTNCALLIQLQASSQWLHGSNQPFWKVFQVFAQFLFCSFSMCYICGIHICVHVHVNGCAYVDTRRCLWRPEIHIGYLLLLVLTLIFFEIVLDSLLIELEAHQFLSMCLKLAGLWVLGICICGLGDRHMHFSLQSCVSACESNPRSSCLWNKSFSSWAISPIHVVVFKMCLKVMYWWLATYHLKQP